MLKTKEKSKGYLNGAVILAIAMLAAKLIGAVYRIPLTNILGAEGIGLYQLAFPIYALMLTLSSSSIPTAIARLVSERHALGDIDGEKKITKAATLTMLIGGVVGAVLLIALAIPLSRLQGNATLATAYFILAPCLVIVAISGLMRGYFQGRLNMRPTAIMQIAEQVSKLILGVALAAALIKYSVMHAVIGAFAAVTLSELLGLAVLYIIYRRDNTARGTFGLRTDFESVKTVGRTAIPIVLSGLIMPLVQFIDSVLIVKVLAWKGLESASAIGEYGMLTGVANTLANMPVVLTLAFAVAIVPTVAMYKSKRDSVNIKSKTAMSIKLAYFIGMPCFIVMAIMSEHVVHALYPGLGIEARHLAATLLRVAAFQIMINSVLQIYGSVLQGVGYQNRAVKHMAIGGAVKLLLDFVLIYYMGIVGAALAAVIGFGLTALLNTIYTQKITGNNTILTKNISKILFAGVIMGLAVCIAVFVNNSYLALAIGIGVGFPIFVITVVLTRCFSAEELSSLPFGDKLATWLYKSE